MEVRRIALVTLLVCDEQGDACHRTTDQYLSSQTPTSTFWMDDAPSANWRTNKREFETPCTATAGENGPTGTIRPNPT
jgi:putative transposase